MSLAQRWRIVKAAFMQSWHEHTCQHCGTQWFCQGERCELWPGNECATCATNAFDQWLERQARKAVA
jgi:hypothetical protein